MVAHPLRSVKSTILVLLFSVVLGIHGQLAAAELTVHAAASLSDAMKEIGAAYERKSGDQIQLNLGASSTLERQIEQGAPGELFLSADEAKMDALETKGLLAPGTRRALLSNSLAIVVRRDAELIPKSAADLALPAYSRIALAEPQIVPAGIYACEFLEKVKLWDALKEKVVPTENVRAALAAVVSGNVEVGFVYKTDALISPKVRIALEIPAADGPKISYPVAVLKSSPDPARARTMLPVAAGSRLGSGRLRSSSRRAGARRPGASSTIS